MCHDAMEPREWTVSGSGKLVASASKNSIARWFTSQRVTRDIYHPHKLSGQDA